MLDPVSFWEGKHRIKSRYWLTGTKPQDVLQQHKIAFSTAPMRIADVGVGFGAMYEHLKGMGHDVVPVDIAANALPGVVHPRDAYFLGPFNFVLCHNVLIHCSDEQVVDIMRLPLAEGGYASLNYVLCPDPSEHQQEQMRRGTHYWSRAADFYRNAADALGLTVDEDFHIGDSSGEGSSVEWRVLRLSRGQS